MKVRQFFWFVKIINFNFYFLALKIAADYLVMHTLTESISLIELSSFSDLLELETLKG